MLGQMVRTFIYKIENLRRQIKTTLYDPRCASVDLTLLHKKQDLVINSKISERSMAIHVERVAIIFIRLSDFIKTISNTVISNSDFYSHALEQCFRKNDFIVEKLVSLFGPDHCFVRLYF